MDWETSPKFRARVAGALYVLCIVCGFFAEMIVRSKLIVYTDPAATARNILASPALYRAGFFADVTAMTLGVLSSIVLYTLLKAVSRTLALTVLILDVISNAVSICGAVLLFAPLAILPGGDGLSVFAPAQLQALALLAIKMYELAYALSLALFSGSCLLTGYLIYRSSFLPKAIGVLLAAAGVCYFINSFVSFMPKGFGDALFPWILLPVLLGEGTVALWLLIVGVNSAKWNEIAVAHRFD
jgi:Domain of unknown function (DUF4386)